MKRQELSEIRQRFDVPKSNFVKLYTPTGEVIINKRRSCGFGTPKSLGSEPVTNQTSQER